MNHAIITTETTGLFDYNKPDDAPGQPRLAAFGFLELTEDMEVEAAYCCWIRPDGWEMHPAASKVNGLTQEFLIKNGMDVEHALGEFTTLVERGLWIYGYSVEFDLNILQAELRRSGQGELNAVKSMSMIHQAKTVCGLLSASGKPRLPKLAEAAKYFGLEWRPQMPIDEKRDLLYQIHCKLGLASVEGLFA